MKVPLLIGLLLLGSTAVHADPKPVGTTPSFETRILMAHNAERARLRQSPLIWSARLAENAEKWARTLAKTGAFEHAPQSMEGENLWAGTQGDYSPEEMVGFWIDEKKFFTAGKFPQVSSSGNWTDVGHYTQLIWYDTTQLGCALATGSHEDVLVCRYDPPGNWIGKRPLGETAKSTAAVQKPKKMPPKPKTK